MAKRLTAGERQRRSELAKKAFFGLNKPLADYVAAVNYCSDGLKIWKPKALTLQTYITTVSRMSVEELQEVLVGTEYCPLGRVA